MDRTRNNPAGFTLIELMVVIGLIALLMGILLPTISRFHRQTLVSGTRNDISLIERACELWGDDNKGKNLAGPFPPSVTTPNTAGDYDWRGAHWLFQKLVREGGGKNYDVQGLKTRQMMNAANKPLDAYVFVDRFDHAILYYQFYKDTQSYHDADGLDKNGKLDLVNTFINPPVDGSNVSCVDTVYAAREVDKNDAKNVTSYWRKDFILISPGPNGQWDPPGPIQAGKKNVYSDSDDITNFWPK